LQSIELFWVDVRRVTDGARFHESLDDKTRRTNLATGRFE
jgi:hypothetical protein